MGMFDNLIYNGKTFQTKDFDCEMTTYAIENDRLIRIDGVREDIPEAEQDPNDFAVVRTWRWKPGVEIRTDMNWHGWVRFYTSNWKIPENVAGEWEEYNAKFTDGVMVEIKRVADSPENRT